MTPDELQISAEIIKHLHPAALHEVCAALHPGVRGDCQTCVQPLAGKPVLRVDELPGFALASLHHAGCRRSQWNSSGNVVFNPGHATTYSMSKWKVGLDHAPGANAIIVLNPRLELARLQKHAVFGWQPAHDPRFTAAGLARLKPEGKPLPVKGVTAFIENGSLKIRMRDDMTVFPRTGDECEDPAEILAAARDTVYLFITHATDPDWIGASIDGLTRVCHDPGTICGKLTLH